MGCERIDPCAKAGGMTRKNSAAVALGKRGGKSKSPAKSAASRSNGAKGGRPRKPRAPDEVPPEDAASK